MQSEISQNLVYNIPLPIDGVTGVNEVYDLAAAVFSFWRKHENTIKIKQ